MISLLLSQRNVRKFSAYIWNFMVIQILFSFLIGTQKKKKKSTSKYDIAAASTTECKEFICFYILIKRATIKISIFLFTLPSPKQSKLQFIDLSTFETFNAIYDAIVDIWLHKNALQLTHRLDC